MISLKSSRSFVKFGLPTTGDLTNTSQEATEMDGVYQELEKVKTEMENLKEECQTKMELSESLREAHNEQLIKLKEAKSRIEKQVEELNAKSEEISELRQHYEDLKSSLHEKEFSLKHLRSADEKLRVDYSKRTQELQGENKELALALDEATTRTQDLESKICAGNEEIECLKRLLSDRQKKFLEAEQQTQASKELQQRDDMILKVEEENRNVQDQLKWKNEQFKHLEEAHEKLQDQFWSSKAKWGKEKSALFEEICTLQTSLDSQTRITENLQTQLRMCNQALACEESRRKILEVQVSEYNLNFENVFVECEEAKSKIEHLTLKRDEEIAKLRNLLGTKETVFKEIEHRVTLLEQENQELRGSLKEFQEAQIINPGTNLLKKLQNKMKGLEQLHSKCSTNLKEKEFEWSDRMDKVTRDANGYISELKGKNEQILKLQEELEGCHFLLEVQNEEISVVIMVLKSEFSAAYSKLFSGKSGMELHNKEKDEKILLLTEKLEIKTRALEKNHANFEQKCEEVAFLMERIESIDRMKQQQMFMDEELEKQKEMLAESSECQVCLKEQVLQMENALKQDAKNVSNALEKANCELAKKMCEVNQAELELQKWKDAAENLKIYLEENQKARKRENESLLGIVKEQEENIGNLQQQITLLEFTIAAKTDAMQASKQEKEHYIQIAEDKNNSIKNLRNENEEKNKKIVNLEMEVNASCKKLEFQEESLFHSKKQAEQLEALLQANKLETEKAKDQFGNERRHLEGLVKDLEFRGGALLEDIRKLLSDREDLLVQIEGICEQVSEFSGKDLALMGILGKILQSSDEEKGLEMNFLESAELNDSTSRIVKIPFFPSRNGLEESIDNRSPLMELNH